MPAAVEPAQPPIKLVNTSKSGIKPGQAAALVLVKPVPVPDEAIEYIHDGLTAVEEQGGLKKGEKVQINEGPFRGVEGIFQAYDGEERAIVLISFMQKQQVVKVRLGDL